LQSALSQVFNLPTAACEQRSADYKSAIRQIENLRYGIGLSPLSILRVVPAADLGDLRSRCRVIPNPQPGRFGGIQAFSERVEFDLRNLIQKKAGYRSIPLERDAGRH
jgi:hypothetical protein